MGMRHQIPQGARLKALTVSGKVTVISEDRSDIEIDPPDRRLEVHEDVVEAHAKSTDLVIRVPHGLNISVGTVSGDIELQGRFGILKVGSVSGHVRVGDTAGDADLRSISGHIECGDCGGSCQANTKSGHIHLEHVQRNVLAHTMSGSIEAGVGGQGDVVLKTISGRVSVRVDSGKAPRAKLRSLSGRVRCECPQGGDFELKASSISGSIEVVQEE